VAFVIFGLAAVILATFILPLLSLWPSRDHELRTQRAIQRSLRLFTWLMQSLRLIRVSWKHPERIPAHPVVFIANHPSLIDVVLILGRLPQADCIVKQATLRNPFLRRVVRQAGYLTNDGGAALLQGAVQRLHRGRCLLVFPEGTRSPVGGLGRFRRGAARVALESRCPIIPIVITCQPRTLLRGQKWHDVPDRPAHYTLDVQQPIVPDNHARLPHAVAARRLTADLHRVYEAALHTEMACP
jgi:1-acyl-sn-glycerol-3-phosphate acyltransferase